MSAHALQLEAYRKWDPGGIEPGGVIQNDRLYEIMASAETSESNSNDSIVDVSDETRTELDSHANNVPILMVRWGLHLRGIEGAYVFT